MEREKTKPSQGRAKKPTQEATTYELLTHRITGKKLNPQKKPFVIRSYALAAENEETLADLRQTASDAIGQTISGSALLRALLRYVGQQPPAWTAQQLYPLIEAEIEQGRLWGTQPKKGNPSRV